MTPLERYLTAKQVSDATTVATSTLTLWRKQGIGPTWVPLGPKRVAYPESGLRAWLTAKAAR